MAHRPIVTRRRIRWWFLVPLLTLGAVTFPVVGYAAWRLRSVNGSRWHLAAAAGYFLLLIGFSVTDQLLDPNKSGGASAILLVIFLISWLIGRRPR